MVNRCPNKYGHHYWAAAMMAIISFSYVEWDKFFHNKAWLKNAMGREFGMSIALIPEPESSHSTINGLLKIWSC
jgi:hypothetical protein